MSRNAVEVYEMGIRKKIINVNQRIKSENNREDYRKILDDMDQALSNLLLMKDYVEDSTHSQVNVG